MVVSDKNYSGWFTIKLIRPVPASAGVSTLVRNLIVGSAAAGDMSRVYCRLVNGDSPSGAA